MFLNVSLFPSTVCLLWARADASRELGAWRSGDTWWTASLGHVPVPPPHPQHLGATGRAVRGAPDVSGGAARHSTDTPSHALTLAPAQWRRWAPARPLPHGQLDGGPSCSDGSSPSPLTALPAGVWAAPFLKTSSSVFRGPGSRGPGLQRPGVCVCRGDPWHPPPPRGTSLAKLPFQIRRKAWKTGFAVDFLSWLEATVSVPRVVLEKLK